MECQVYIEEIENKDSYVLNLQPKKKKKKIRKPEPPLLSLDPIKVPKIKEEVIIDEIYTDEAVLNEEPAFKCQYCPLSLDDEKEFNQHLKTHREKEKKKKKYLCRDCGKSFPELSEVEQHLRIHAREKPFKCKLCGKRFAQRMEINQHIQEIHMNNDDINMRLAPIKREHHEKPETPATESTLNKFLKQNCIPKEMGGLVFLKCSHCDAFFLEAPKLEEHLDVVHDKREIFTCSFCNEQFAGKAALEEHEGIHVNNRGYYFVPKEEPPSYEDKGSISGDNMFPYEHSDDDSRNVTHIPSILDETVFQDVMHDNKIYRTVSGDKPCYIVLPKKIAMRKGIMSNNPDIRELSVNLLMDSSFSNLHGEMLTLHKKLKNKGEDEDDNEKQHNSIVVDASNNEYHIKDTEVYSAIQNIQGENTTIIDQDGNVHYQDFGNIHHTVINADGCEETTSTIKDDDSNYSTATAVLNQPYSHMCNFCSSLYQSYDELNDHLKMHDDVRPYPCDFCARWYKNLATLNDHITTHTEDRPYSCEFCERAFAKTSQLKYHIEHKHIAEQKTATRFDPDNTVEFYCKLCRKIYLDSTFKKAHMNEHANISSLLCHQCGQTFKDEVTIQRHLPVHLHQQPKRPPKALPKITPIIKCVDLQRTEGKAPSKYKCQICSRVFNNEKNLLVHEKLHGSKSIECKYCDAKFRNFTELKTHMKQHVDKNAPYSCSLCFEGFESIERCREHIKSDHMGKRTATEQSPNNPKRVSCPLITKVSTKAVIEEANTIEVMSEEPDEYI